MYYINNQFPFATIEKLLIVKLSYILFFFAISFNFIFTLEYMKYIKKSNICKLKKQSKVINI